VDETAKKKVESEPSQPVTGTQPTVATAPQSIATTPSPSQGAIQVAVAPARPSKLKSTTQLTPPVLATASAPEHKNDTAGDTGVATPAGRTEELSFETLQTAWYEFAEKRRQSKNSTTEEIALRKEFRLSGHTIEVILDNDHQLEAIQNMRYDLLGFLKNRFNEPKLDINPRVAPQEVNRLPYTPAEKFSFLAEKNPHLLELRQALGLDVDF
ncbi:MAG TPA: DNA polymerase III subunit gamma/tau, partial [Dyadobacter sp.]|nr:DNA polymerase III subunit gamma/tau [Dyadobacter sp.]